MHSTALERVRLRIRLLPASLLLATLAMGILPASAAGADAGPVPDPATDRDERMGWFREARFGMFIHWGLYAVLGGEFEGRPVNGAGEWIMETGKIPVSKYERLVSRFNPVQFDARRWARIAKDAGMRYLVITSKHHDGFALWDSQASAYDVMATPFRRDILKELAEACRAEGIRFCLYHSIMDWHHPDWGTRRAWHDTATGTPDMDRYTAYMKAQLKELLTGYGPLGILWFDGEWESPWTHARGVDLDRFVRSFQPAIIVNNRVGKGRAGMSGMDEGAERVGDYGTPEQEIPATGFGPGVDWESCMTMNDTWGFKRSDEHWKSATTLVRNLIDCASKGGNYLLNVGPTPEGLIPAASVERLAAIGAWMRVNDDAIYGTTASPFKKLAWGRATQKPGRLFLHVFDWPAGGALAVPLASPVKRAYLLAAPAQALATEAGDAGLTVRVPAAAPTPHAAVVVLELEGAPRVLETRIRQAADGSITLDAATAEILGHSLKLETKDGVPNLGFWTDAKDLAQWPIAVSQAGEFEVEANFACAPGSEGSECVLTVGDRHLTATVQATGGWDDFTHALVGTIPIPRTGNATVTVKTTYKRGDAVVNLRSLVLRRVP